MVRYGRLLIWVMTLVMASTAAGCAKPGIDTPRPPLNLPVADDSVTAVVAALSALDVSSAPLDSSSVLAQDDVAQIVSGMDGYLPRVTAGPLVYAKDQPEATLTLTYTWAFPGGDWTYQAPVRIVHSQGWKLAWSPSVIHPALDATNRLVHTRTPAKRAGITGNNGVALVEEHTVVRVGIDKTLIGADQWDASARALAGVVGVNADAFAKQVVASGPRAFVVAITMRQGQVPAAVASVKGAAGVEAKAMLPLSNDFADELIGVVGEATTEIIKASQGQVMAGDQVGLTGLQRRHDAQLRGTPGDRVTIVARRAPSAAPASSSPTPSTAATGASSSVPPTGSRPSTASASARPASPQASVTPVVTFSTNPVPGTPLQISLDLDRQLKAEQVMATVPGAAAVAMVRPSDGAVLAVANSPGSAGQPDANFGSYAPGSTFKIATTLALLRKGYTPDSTVNCTATTTVNGWPFKNYSDFPSSRVGRIALKDAVAASCNTAFINEYGTISGDDLVAAAGSLGVGVDYDAQAPAFYGQVPKPDSDVKKAQEFIGQGGVLASPLAMAGLAASVASGHTVVPWLVASAKPVSTAAPLTAAEAEQLRTVMSYTVQAGSGRVLSSVAVGAKTGTAEYGTGTSLPTHAWMICYTAHDLAVAVWVKDGQSGSGTAGPLIVSVLS